MRSTHVVLYSKVRDSSSSSSPSISDLLNSFPHTTFQGWRKERQNNFCSSCCNSNPPVKTLHISFLRHYSTTSTPYATILLPLAILFWNRLQLKSRKDFFLKLSFVFSTHPSSLPPRRIIHIIIIILSFSYDWHLDKKKLSCGSQVVVVVGRWWYILYCHVTSALFMTDESLIITIVFTQMHFLCVRVLLWH